MSPFDPPVDRAPSSLWLRGFWVCTGAAVVASSSRSIRLRWWTDSFAASAVGSYSSVAPTIARSCLQARHASAIQLLRGLRQAARNKAVMSVANRRAWRTWRSTGRRPALQVQAHNSSVPLTLLVRRHCCLYARSQRIQDFETANSSQ